MESRGTGHQGSNKILRFRPVGEEAVSKPSIKQRGPRSSEIKYYVEKGIMEYLPIRIVKMVKALHARGYTSIYLFSGMSPSGTHWRYCIGNMVNNEWPARPYIVSGSLHKEGDTEWASDNSTVELLADGFEFHYRKQIERTKSSQTAYSLWFEKVVNSLDRNELLVFFADYSAPHEHLLDSAPCFKGH